MVPCDGQGPLLLPVNRLRRVGMIQVNGEPMEWREGLTVRGVLTAKNYRFPLLVVTIDGRFVKRENYDSTTVPDGAELKVVHLMSGG